MTGAILAALVRHALDPARQDELQRLLGREALDPVERRRLWGLLREARTCLLEERPLPAMPAADAPLPDAVQAAMWDALASLLRLGRRSPRDAVALRWMLEEAVAGGQAEDVAAVGLLVRKELEGDHE